MTKEEITLDSIKQLVDDAAHWDNKTELIEAIKDTIEADRLVLWQWQKRKP